MTQTKIERLIASMNKSADKVEKIEKTIDKHYKQLDKKIAIVEKAGHKVDYSKIDFHTNYSDFKQQMKPIENQKWADGKSVAEYWELCDVCGKMDDIRNSYKKLEEAKTVLSNWGEKVLQEKKKVDYVNNEVPQVIIDFVEKWKVSAYEWMMANTNYPNPANIMRMVENEKQIKIIQLTSRVNEVVGKITDAKGLNIGEKGDLTGIIAGEKGNARVETIDAGGWNIQRYHYRTIVTAL